LSSPRRTSTAPSLRGERTPYPDPNARGAIVGLTLRHTKAHLTRALLEGISFALRDSVELMRGMGMPLTQVCASGGGARSALWRQILADVLDVEIATVNVAEGAAFGAALLAGVGAGVCPDVESACAATVRLTGTIKPSDDKWVYANHYRRFRALYPALKSEFAAVAEVVARMNRPREVGAF
jgi:xylulokinase